MKKVLFWCVDCQKDFIEPTGKLYVAGAEKIIPNLVEMTKLAKKYNLTTIYTADWHNKNSKEITDKPDFITTFPEHCMMGSSGCHLIKEIENEMKMNFSDFEHMNFFEFDWKDNENEVKQKLNDPDFQYDDIFIYKDAFDVFVGNKYTEEIVKKINPSIVVVYGVATNVCVNYAVLGLAKRGIKVIVVIDAIKELPNLLIDNIIDKWIDNDVCFSSLDINEEELENNVVVKLLVDKCAYVGNIKEELKEIIHPE
jgi:nicotinamidase/pyrazinamidase